MEPQITQMDTDFLFGLILQFGTTDCTDGHGFFAWVDISIGTTDFIFVPMLSVIFFLKEKSHMNEAD